ncbi:MAG: FdtA/QdtA family cupin domain-containing protein [Moraxellaceae bacterium]|nr:FdtA/QdtA family cupin domain-containing protein [Moraxellaceae bacterium]
MSLVQLLTFRVLGDERGQLVALEAGRNIPFDIRRTYYLVGTSPSVARGFHAHRELQQVAICVAGRCRMVMDDGQIRRDVWLDSPDKGILLPPMVWHEMHDFSVDCVLLVLASDHYLESDYVRDYAEFQRLVRHADNTSLI